MRICVSFFSSEPSAMPRIAFRTTGFPGQAALPCSRSKPVTGEGGEDSRRASDGRFLDLDHHEPVGLPHDSPA
jgi:hypothetical protein